MTDEIKDYTDLVCHSVSEITLPSFNHLVTGHVMRSMEGGQVLQLNENECTHSDEQRALTGTWVLDDVRKFIEKGYSVLEIYEVWKYQVVNGLFREYIDEYLKIKQQATGWPLGCDSTEEKQKYIQQYLEKEGVKLNPDKIAKNSGLRQVGKAVITSFWGKLGQRENQSKTTIVNDPAQFFSLLTNPTINVNTVQTINENTLVVNWEHKEDVYDPVPTVNVCLAAKTHSSLIGNIKRMYMTRYQL
ncbi:hypothetical protein QE152_g32145 [Popillia japonica]|uniref:DNA-directed DNA polymerase n=1 Tax=Popillia japonica TaxID=7064 RepID=A0AAW1J078_POPJA